MTSRTRATRVAPLSRRTFLRGVGGLAIGLPLLDIMRPAKAANVLIPARYLLGFGGFSLSTDRSEEEPTLIPSGLGYPYQLHPTAMSLQDLKEEITWVSGLSIPRAGEGEDAPPGGRLRNEDSFHYHHNALLAGRHQVGDFRDNTVTGPTTDQVVADVLGRDTLFPSLQIKVQANNYYADANPNSSVMSFRQVGNSVTRMTPYTSPRQLFDTLTSGFLPSDPVESAARVAELERGRSVLDLVDRRLDGLVNVLGTEDRQRMERHLDEVRELERRLGAPLASATDVCQPPSGWYEDPPIDMSGWSDENSRSDRFADLIRFAMACDLCRVFTVQYTNFGPMISGEALGADPKPAHVAIHEGPNYNIEAIAGWHMERFGGLLRRLLHTPEAGGALIDSSAIGYLIEGGFAKSDYAPTLSTSHSTESMLMLTAGHVGGLRPGRHVQASQGYTHPVQVMMGLMNAAGVPVQSHGEVEGPSPDL